MKIKFLGGNHAIYQEMVKYPPKGITYTGVSKKTVDGKYYQTKKLNSRISKIFQFLHLPRMFYIFNCKEPLIHSSRGIIILNKKPWVMDIEHPSSFSGMNLRLIERSKLMRMIIKKKLESNYCNRVMFHCEASLKRMEQLFDCKNIKNKMEVLYPATHLFELRKKKMGQKIIILSVLALFKEKGGVQVLEAFTRLEKEFKNIELWIKADVPEEYKKKYNSPNIKYFPYSTEILSRENLLNKYYSQADIFLYPTFADTFGYSLIDAMLAKLPIVASDNFAIPEIVLNNKNGFLVHAPFSYANERYDNRCINLHEDYIDAMLAKMRILIRNPNLRLRMGEQGFNFVKNGKFSIKARNSKLKKIYLQALNNKKIKS
jgi:glycosyltransferase involved in cell wall biosynthesis